MIGPDERQGVIDALAEHFAEDRLTVQEFERRLDRAHAAREPGELRALLEDLPAEPTAPGTPRPTPSHRRVPAPAEGEVRQRGTEISIWGGTSRTGSWTPPRRHTAVAVQGGIELDYRDARLAPGVYELRAVAVMGAVEVIVPPDLRVEADGSAVLGSFEHEGATGTAGSAEASVLRVGGFAFMGSVEVVVVEPGRSLEEGGSR